MDDLTRMYQSRRLVEPGKAARDALSVGFLGLIVGACGMLLWMEPSLDNARNGRFVIVAGFDEIYRVDREKHQIVSLGGGDVRIVPRQSVPRWVESALNQVEGQVGFQPGL